MTTPVNLNRYRKQRARADRKARADENALKHGRSKAAKARDAAEAARQDSRLSGHRRDPGDDDPPR